MRIRTVAISCVALSCLLVAGCVGIGHIQVSVPEVRLNVRSTTAELTIDLVCPDFYAEAESFVALVSQSLSTQSNRYDWKRLIVGSNETHATCREESRYIGLPVIAFLPTAPSSQTAKSRALFVHVAGENTLYRLQVNGSAVRVESTNFDDAKRKYPALLNQPEPASLEPGWSERIQLRSDYYSAAKWQPSKRIVITRVEADNEGAITSLAIELRRDN
jgi:hypothetical protein